MILAFTLLSFAYAKAQESSTKLVYKEVGTDKIYTGIIYYDKDKSGDIFVTEYKVYGVENGDASGEFYNRKDYPFSNMEEVINGKKYKYQISIGCCGMGYFNVTK